MSQEIMRANLLLLVDEYARITGLSESQISKKLYDHQDFLGKYRAGEVSPTIKKYYDLVDKIRERWPVDAPWPKTDPIPKLGKKIQIDASARAQSQGIG